MQMPSPLDGGFADPAFEPSNDFAFDDELGLQDSDALSSLGSPTSLNSNMKLHVGLESEFKPKSFSSGLHRGQGVGVAAMSAVRAETAKRSPTVALTFGNITPPDDDAMTQGMLNIAPDPESPVPVGSFEAVAAPRPEVSPRTASMSSRSERARNAANHRHSRSKQVKRESVSSDAEGSNAEDHSQTDHKREKYREKNRVAAAKCRAKKKMNSDHLEGSARDTERENTRLKLEERKLRDELTRLKEISLAHHPGGCECSNIHTYNTSQALRTAQGATGAMAAFKVASPPSGGSGGSISPLSPAVVQSGSATNAQQFHSSANYPAGAFPYAEHQQFTPQQLGIMQMMMENNNATMQGTTDAYMAHDMHADFQVGNDGQGFAEYLQNMEVENLGYE